MLCGSRPRAPSLERRKSIERRQSLESTAISLGQAAGALDDSTGEESGQNTLHTILWDTLSIGTGHECDCGYQITEAEIMASWEHTDQSFSASCPECMITFVPTLKVMYTVIVDTFESIACARAAAQARAPRQPSNRSGAVSPTSTPGARSRSPIGAARNPPPRPITTGWKEIKMAVPYLCPLVLRRELQEALRAFREDFFNPETFRGLHEVLFWNLYWVFSSREEPLSVDFHLGPQQSQALNVSQLQVDSIHDDIFSTKADDFVWHADLEADCLEIEEPDRDAPLYTAAAKEGMLSRRPSMIPGELGAELVGRKVEGDVSLAAAHAFMPSRMSSPCQTAALNKEGDMLPSAFDLQGGISEDGPTRMPALPPAESAVRVDEKPAPAEMSNGSHPTLECSCCSACALSCPSAAGSIRCPSSYSPAVASDASESAALSAKRGCRCNTPSASTRGLRRHPHLVRDAPGNLNLDNLKISPATGARKESEGQEGKSDADAEDAAALAFAARLDTVNSRTRDAEALKELAQKLKMRDLAAAMKLFLRKRAQELSEFDAGVKIVPEDIKHFYLARNMVTREGRWLPTRSRHAPCWLQPMFEQLWLLGAKQHFASVKVYATRYEDAVLYLPVSCPCLRAHTHHTPAHFLTFFFLRHQSQGQLREELTGMDACPADAAVAFDDVFKLSKAREMRRIHATLTGDGRTQRNQSAAASAVKSHRRGRSRVLSLVNFPEVPEDKPAAS